MSRCLMVLIWMAILLPPAAEGKPIRYCLPESGARGGFEIDLRAMTMTYEGIATLKPLIVGDLLGIESTFPILLFDQSLDREVVADGIIANGYEFRFAPVETNHSDWWTITARPLTKAHDRVYSLVLYSVAHGVLAINVSGDDELLSEFTFNFLSCSERTLRFENLKRALQGKGVQVSRGKVR